LRLARFNTQVGKVDSEHFVGLPIPAAAGMCAVTILICHKLGIEAKINPIIVLVMIYALSFLMVSSIRYNSFKKPELFKRMNFNMLVASILILIFIAAQPSIALFLFGVVYVLSGPVTAFRFHRAKKDTDAEAQKGDEESSSPI
jgi:CDP-diacylglycerol--serine O-phosphatidyltransferase